ncbi:MAG: hypothetical protein ABI295_05410 [Xanthomarina sp.]
MKKIIFLLTALILGGLSVSATTAIEANHVDHSATVRGYGNSFIFVENGIEFSIFPDGQFDFYMPSYGPNVNVYGPGVSISFNSGYNYNPYLQYDEYGAIIQVEHVPVYYDYYGRVARIGNVFVNYNGFGYVSQIGGLYLHYNSYKKYSHFSGYINTFNPYYVYRPWHAYYRIPTFHHVVVYHKPYRQYYTPVRYTYNAPYTNNYRRTTAVASRRGNTVSRQSELATRPTQANNTPRRDLENIRPNVNNNVAANPRSNTNTVRPREGSEVSTPRSNNQVAANPRSNTNTVRPQGSEVSTPRSNNQVAANPRSNTSTVRPREASEMSTPKSNNQVATNPRSNTNIVRPREASEVSTPRSNNQVATKPRANNTLKPRAQTVSNTPKPVVKNNVPERKPNATNNRTYNKENTSRGTASNSGSRR